MQRTTRLMAEPDRRVRYDPASLAAPLHNVVPRDVSPAPDSAMSEPAKPPKVRKQCLICSFWKTAERYFGSPDDIELCLHLDDICKPCLGEMLTTRMDNRNFEDTGLECPFGACGHVIDFPDLRTMVSRDTFEAWDNALLLHAFRTSQSFAACLNPDCGKYFSVEGPYVDCAENSRHGFLSQENAPTAYVNKNKIACPYCSYELCNDCNRPWHAGQGCDKNKLADDEKSEHTMKELGVKACPQCRTRIEKNGGCIHMSCNQCGYQFCFSCLVPYQESARHTEDCVLIRGDDLEDDDDDDDEAEPESDDDDDDDAQPLGRLFHRFQAQTYALAHGLLNPLFGNNTNVHQPVPDPEREHQGEDHPLPPFPPVTQVPPQDPAAVAEQADAPFHFNTANIFYREAMRIREDSARQPVLFGGAGPAVPTIGPPERPGYGAHFGENGVTTEQEAEYEEVQYDLDREMLDIQGDEVRDITARRRDGPTRWDNTVPFR